MSTAAFGGTAPLINDAVVSSTGNSYFPAFYLMAAALVALVPIMLMKETARKPLMQEAPSAAPAS